MAGLAEKQEPKLSAGERWDQTWQTVEDHVAQYWQTYIIERLLRQYPLQPSKDGRHVPLRVEHPESLVDERRNQPYIANTIRTSRYTVWNFLPKQLFFQFSRLANFYFLCIGIPQTIPGLSTTGSFTTILPLLLFVFLTIAKEGYDDFKRSRLDKVENATPATVLRSRTADIPPIEEQQRSQDWLSSTPFASKTKIATEVNVQPAVVDEDPDEEYAWRQVMWRDIRVGDIVKLSRDEPVPADVVLLRANGENGLAFIETMDLDGETNLKSREPIGDFKDCDTISGLRACQAEFVLEDPNPDLYRFDGRVKVNGKTLPLTSNEVVYRGSTLRNTGCAIGLVINTGEECKIRMNANQHPHAKKPALEKVANRIVLILVVYVAALTAGCTRGYDRWQRSTEENSWYIEDAPVGLDQTVMGYAIMYNNNIPLSLYITLEIVRIGQLLMLNGDEDMYDEATNTPAQCNTNTILENLGQVTHIFSDKTGTLTDNVMKFRKMSIAGTIWLHVMGDTTDSDEDETPKTHESGLAGAPQDGIELAPLSSPSSVFPGQSDKASSLWNPMGPEDNSQAELTTADLIEFIRLRPSAPFSRRASDYILCLALCHTCLPEWKDGHVEFQAASPDELALVRAAKELGYLVMHRSNNSVTLKITTASGDERAETYQILDVIEFSSKRKRMSIIVRYPDGRIGIICKGADSAIMPRLKLAHLAKQKAAEVRNSVDAETERLRRSEQMEVRNSFGGRPSLTIRRSMASNRHSLAVHPTSPRHHEGMERSRSVEPPPRESDDEKKRPALNIRTRSFDHSKRFSAPSPLPAGAQDKFAFLDDPSILDESTVFARCFKHLDEAATEGLRTLLIAKKYIPEQEYKAWRKVYDDATTSLVGRQDLIEAAGEMIEQSFDLVGATAIEDKLQKGVPETIEKLRRANVKIWMLTGDKRETAINIAHSARLCRPTSDIFILDVERGSLEDQIRDISHDLRNGCLHSVVVIDGLTLQAVDENPELADSFYTLIPTIDSVICCRASPSQKQLIVEAIRRKVPRALTLAIGDGANDLAMISASHVGVGISGKEGLQAARVADFSIAQFRFLQRLLLVHGRWNYVRTGRFILATFWKEMFFYLPTAMYQRYNGFTGTSLYESWSLTALNTLFTSLCTICLGTWEQDLSAETLLAVPELYVYGQRNSELNIVRFLLWMASGATEGVLVWLGIYASYVYYGQARDENLFAIGNLAFTICVVWTNYKLFMLETHHKTTLVMSCFGITFAGWWLWQCFLAGAYTPSPTPYAGYQAFFETYGPDPVWWLTFIAITAALVTLEMGFKTVKRSLVLAGVWRWPPWSALSKASRDDNSAEEWNLEIWQELEQVPAIRARLKRMCAEGGGDVGELEELRRSSGNTGDDEVDLERVL